jgi:hypothetical protein
MLTRSMRWALICTIATATSPLLPLPIAQAEQAELTDTEPPCYVIYGNGDQENLTNLCGMGRAPVALPAAAIGPESASGVPETPTTGGTVLLTSCSLHSGGEGIAYAAGVLLNDTGAAIRNITIAYEVTGPEGQRVHDNRLRIANLAPGASGQFSGQGTSPIRIDQAPKPLQLRITNIQWQNAAGQRDSTVPTNRCY